MSLGPIFKRYLWMKEEKNISSIIANSYLRVDLPVDIFSPQKRSWNMSRIKSKNTTPEQIVRSFLHRQGFRFRLHVKSLPGTPDIVLPKYKAIIEVRGCYWHRHPGCRQTTTPSTNVEFWQEKFKRNVERDRCTEKRLKELGWDLIVVWECETVQKKFPPNCLRDFVSKHKNGFIEKI